MQTKYGTFEVVGPGRTSVRERHARVALVEVGAKIMAKCEKASDLLFILTSQIAGFGGPMLLLVGENLGFSRSTLLFETGRGHGWCWKIWKTLCEVSVSLSMNESHSEFRQYCLFYSPSARLKILR